MNKLDTDFQLAERRDRSERRRTGDKRSPYVRDLGRVIHSSTFRRLQGKMQVLGHGEGDFYRTRLTHSLEAAQIGRGIVRQLKKTLPRDSDELASLPELELAETICLAHDLGHPPFGHAGERALQAKMVNSGGFEGNGQTLRLVARIEELVPEHGLNLTRRAILGVLKYPKPYGGFTPHEPDFSVHPPKCYLDSEADIVNWALEPFSPSDRANFVSSDANGKAQYKTLDATIMELADDIAFGVHDLEDAIALRLISRSDLRRFLSARGLAKGKSWKTKLFDDAPGARKKTVGHLVNHLVTSIGVNAIPGFDSPLLKYRAELPAEDIKLLHALKEIVFERVVKRPEVRSLELRGEFLLAALFESFAKNPDVMSSRWRSRYDAATTANDKLRVVCDFIAGMTDEYATRYYERLFVPRRGSIFEHL